MTNENMYSKTILKSFDILDCFISAQNELGISDISAKMDLPVSSVHRIIQSLEYEGMLFQNPETRKYRVGAKVLTLFQSQAGRYFDECQRIAFQYVNELSLLTKETVNLAIGSQDNIINIYKANSQFVLRPDFALNTPYPAHCTATGRIFLSEMNDATLEWIYENAKSEIKVSKESFLAMLHQVRSNGYALDDEAFCPGLRCVSAPIRNANKKVIFAISISAPCVRMDDAKYGEARRTVMRFASEASAAICDLES